jgi:AraC-like DNA-binding protein
VVHYFERTPVFSLLPYVECIWTLKSQSQYFQHRERIIPGGRMEMIFNLGARISWIDSADMSFSNITTTASVLGPRNRHFFVEHQGDVHLVGVRFRHGGFASFTAMPMTVFLNELTPQTDIFGGSIDDLVDQLLESEDDHLLKIENFLLKRLRPDPEISKALHLIGFIKNNIGAESLRVVCGTAGVHYKKLERVFNQYTGYNPKNFSRVVRFYKALQQMGKSSASLTGIGLNQGYYDQPHFIRDFKAFTGKSPTQFHAEKSTITNLLLQSRHV